MTLRVFSPSQRTCPYCTWFTTSRPLLRAHIRNQHPTLPQYMRRPPSGHYTIHKDK